uniref:Si:ch211-191d15.2 n=1 Tax=Takifugu rubripes TaxID=31033 RepID=H2UHN2_TAKRU
MSICLESTRTRNILRSQEDHVVTGSSGSPPMWTLLLLWLCPLVSLMSPCPTGCCCLGAGSLVLCESLGLRSLPRSVPLRTSALSVARNQLCNVDHQFLAFSGLQDLGKLGNLTRLDLEYNHIRAIQPGALQALSKLRVLTLKGNKLTSVPGRLPTSLARLDLSENCISALDLPSLSSLVNLQSLKINSNRLRSVPGSAFDSLARLRSLDLANNLWACRCDILYLYRWLLSGGVRTAADIVCTEPTHLAHHVLVNLTVLDICPRVPGSSDRQNLDLTSEGKLVILENKTEFENPLKQTSEVTNVGVHPHMLADYYALGNITFEGCFSLTKTQSAGSNLLKN